MYKRVFSVMVILTILASSFFYVSGTRQPAFVGSAQAADTTLFAEAGIAAYVQLAQIDLAVVKPAFLTIEYVDPAGLFFLGYVDIPIYEEEYNPLVFVNTAGWIVAFYPQANPAGKVVDVIARTTNKTLLEKAVDTVAAKVGASGYTINHYDFRNPDAASLLLVAEDKADGNAFTLFLPEANVYDEISYGFYQTFGASFTIDNVEIDQVSFVLSNADYVNPITYGTIFGHFPADPLLEPTLVPFPLDITNEFAVASGSLYAFGALAIEGDVTGYGVWDEDFERLITLDAPDGLENVTFDLTPTAPDKVSPDNGETGVVLNPILNWADSTAPNYEYCIDTVDNGACDTAWVSTGAVSEVSLSNLFYETTYYWQVRAVNSFDTIYANEGVWWWSFTTARGAAPEAFTKNEETLVEKAGSASKLTMTWETSYGAYYYEYCIDTTPDCIAPELWHNVGLATTVTTSDLEFDTTYFWQVRAVNYFPSTNNVLNYTYADGGWFTFFTRNFSKLSPTDGELISTSTSAVLKWELTGPADSYEYCVSTSDGVCTAWKSAGTADNVTVKALLPETIYYWQVQAVTSDGTFIEANAGDWWAFKTAAKKKPTPTLFKVSPVDGAVEQLTALTLDWEDYKVRGKVSPTIDYQYCYFDIDDTDTTPISVEDTCTNVDANWVSTGKVSDVGLSGLLYETTYYWQVRVPVDSYVDEDGLTQYIYVYGDHGEYWSFTTTVAPTLP